MTGGQIPTLGPAQAAAHWMALAVWAQVQLRWAPLLLAAGPPLQAQVVPSAAVMPPLAAAAAEQQPAHPQQVLSVERPQF